jgi:hypothetical protein
VVAWTVQADGALAGTLRRGLGQEMTDWLRSEFGQARPAVWTASLDVESTLGISEELYEEDTILGDFLRAVREHQQNGKLELDFAALLPEMSNNRAFRTSLQSVDRDTRGALLEEAAVLGADLLRGEEIL